MIIQSSNVNMSSGYKKTTYEQASIHYTEAIGSNFTEALLTDTGTAGSQQELMLSALQAGQMKVTTETGKDTLYSMLQNEGAKEQIQKAATDPVREWEDINLSDPEKLEFRSLENLLDLISDKLTVKKMSADDMFKRLLELYRTKLETALFGSRISGTSGLETTGISSGTGITEEWVQETNITNFRAELEETEFQSAGTVTTADGRSIGFDLSFTMSRSFVSYTEVSVDYKQIMMIDPLVVNLGSDTADVSDEKFYFDIDADGEEDNISLLGKMSGFLALDRNGDGTINDGSELFGAESGDGFSELAVFDLDRNGWIDEKDEIFNRLKIWKKDDEGNDKLVALGVAGIGAIYLGNVATKHELKNENQTGTNAQIQKSGVFLRENGTAGTIQHVDLAAS